MQLHTKIISLSIQLPTLGNYQLPGHLKYFQYYYPLAYNMFYVVNIGRYSSIQIPKNKSFCPNSTLAKIVNIYIEALRKGAIFTQFLSNLSTLNNINRGVCNCSRQKFQLPHFLLTVVFRGRLKSLATHLSICSW